MLSLTVPTHRSDDKPTTTVRKKSLGTQDGASAATTSSPGGGTMTSTPGRRISTASGESVPRGRRYTLLPLPPQDSARVLRQVSRDDLLVRTDSHIAYGTGQQRNMTTIGSVRYRPSKGQPAREIKVENTYRMEPVVSFRSSRAEEIIRSVFKDIFGSVSGYPEKPEETRHLVKMAANEIRNRTRMLNVDRYKIIVLVNVGQRGGQSVRVASRCLWAVASDTWASATFEARNLFAVGTVFAIYTE